MNGWIKLHKSLLDWEWYDDINATRLLIHLLISVNYEDKKWHGVTIKAGSMVLSWDTLAESSGLSKRQCRTAMEKLEKSKEVTRQPTNRFQLVSLVKWDKLQETKKKSDTLGGSQMTDKRQTDDRQMTPTKESKEVKEVKKENIEQRKLKFASTLESYIDIYGRDMLNDFYEYWTEPNKSKSKFRQEMEKTWALERRLKTWAGNVKSFKKDEGRESTNDLLKSLSQA